ncbi:MAG: HAMP domain-containing sensor histidine kinase [Alphaproteobacteria bacterium]|jgi:signal transduction histidine kinase
MFGAKKFVLPVWSRSLSARLLMLTVVFVMVAEVLIYAPSVANFRINWLKDRIAAAQLAVLALEAAPAEALNDALKRTLLDRAGVMSIGLNRGDRRLMLYTTPPGPVDRTVDTGDQPGFSSIGAAFGTMLRSGSLLLRVTGPAPSGGDSAVEVVVDEADLRDAMYLYSRNILVLSVVISLITATCLYVALQSLLVRPIRRITEQVTEFAGDPENPETGVVASGRGDEIGLAQSVLSEMQTDLRNSLRQRRQLAALGSAVTKINHDLRGILSTAVLVSDRLAGLDDPRVKSIAPPLVQAIDRAVNLCTQTLNFARDEGPQLHPSRFRLAELVDEVAGELSVFGDAPEGQPAPKLVDEIPSDTIVEADRDQLYRVFGNLARNAFEASADTVRVTLDAATGDDFTIDVSDNGPGMATVARKQLFKPFAGSARQGGTGLGLVIARDVMRAHGGDIALLHSGDDGTVFRLTLPRRG